MLLWHLAARGHHLSRLDYSSATHCPSWAQMPNTCSSTYHPLLLHHHLLLKLSSWLRLSHLLIRWVRRTLVCFWLVPLGLFIVDELLVRHISLPFRAFIRRCIDRIPMCKSWYFLRHLVASLKHLPAIILTFKITCIFLLWCMPRCLFVWFTYLVATKQCVVRIYIGLMTELVVLEVNDDV